MLKTKKDNLTHLRNMNSIQFIRWIKSTNGVILNPKLTMKVDGIGARFGKDKEGNIFLESTRSVPIFNCGDFEKYTKNITSNSVRILRSIHYDNILHCLKNSNMMKEFPDNTKCVCEILYNPMGIVNGTKIKFVNVNYDLARLGTMITILPYYFIELDQGNRLDDIQLLSTEEVKIVETNLESTDINIMTIYKDIQLFDSSQIKILLSRKPTFEKENIKTILFSIKKRLEKILLETDCIKDKYKLGKEIEGIVLWINGKGYKITTDKFKSLLSWNK
jgi:hypothetical protein